MDRTALATAGIDVDDALSRVMGNEQLLERLLRMFASNTGVAAIDAAIAAHDVEAAEAASHTLKGTAGNLSIMPVYELATRQCDLFRAGAWDEACALQPAIVSACDAAVRAIETGA